MSRRASLPGADELFRRTTADKAAVEPKDPAPEPQVAKSTRLQVATPVETDQAAPRKAPKHEEKITFYCTRDDLMELEKTRLGLRSEHGVAADRGKIVRAALSYVLEDFAARSSDSILLRKLQEE
ncbi:MAG: hypothetical protein ACRDLB_12445 [Actinomycetota bacterium]